jgi:hypothetical protein
MRRPSRSSWARRAGRTRNVTSAPHYFIAIMLASYRSFFAEQGNENGKIRAGLAMLLVISQAHNLQSG